jgi:hypothetical protein
MARSQGARQAANLRAADRAVEDRRQAQQNPFGGVFAREAFPWEDIDGNCLVDGLAYTCRQGRAVTISPTADGGAVKVTLWADGNKHVAYAATGEDFNTLMEALGPPSAPAAEPKTP